jgi:REP element-mobilizing transposase RayT
VAFVPRLPRHSLPDGFFHVTALGVDSTAIFRDDDDRRFLLALLARAVGAGAWTTHALCLMTTHYHLVIDTTVEKLGAALRHVNGVYAQTFNQRHGRTGHLFGDRYSARVIEDEDYLRVACEYVLNNPVRAGLCAHAAEWRWSWSRYGLSSARGGG